MNTYCLNEEPDQFWLPSCWYIINPSVIQYTFVVYHENYHDISGIIIKTQLVLVLKIGAIIGSLINNGNRQFILCCYRHQKTCKKRWYYCTKKVLMVNSRCCLDICCGWTVFRFVMT